MPDPETLFIIAICVNVFATLLFGLDKLKAKGGSSRVPETTLLIASLPFSAIGAAFGMILFNHKTSKPKFRYGIPLLLIAQLSILYWLGK